MPASVLAWSDGTVRRLAEASYEERNPQKAVLLEVDPNSQQMALVEYAKSLDYDRIEKALDKPPRTEFTATAEPFSVLKKGQSVSRLHDWAGVANLRTNRRRRGPHGPR